MAGVVLWRQMLLDSLEANKHMIQSKYFQLATVKQNGLPAVRTVVFRGFEEGSNKLLVTTDARSRKVDEIKAFPWGEFVVYFGDTWEQFRISGQLGLIGPESPSEQQATRIRLWERSSPKSLLQFISPMPGLPVSDGEVTQLYVDKAEGPLDTFLIVTLEPTKVDYLHLKKEQRLIFESDETSNNWTEKAVNP